MTNEQLIAEFRKTGDRSYLDALYLQTEKFMYKISNTFRCEIDDLYMCFMNAVRDFDESKGKFLTLLGVNCKNAILMERRKKKLNVVSLETPVTEDLTMEDTIEDGKDFLQDLANRDLVDRALGSLGWAYRQVVICYYFRDMKQGDIAKKFHTTQTQISRILAKALAIMKGVVGNGNN